MIDLVEKPVGSSLVITQPAASVKSSEAVGPAFSQSEVPQLLFNSDHSKLAVFFEKNEIAMLFAVQLSSASVTLTLEKEMKNITSFAWSYLPAKYGTIEDKALYITVAVRRSSDP